jgi:hypothetical protein
LASKLVAMVSRFYLKTDGDGFFGLALKLVAPVW